MSDANKYVNVYIENAVALLHEDLNNILQLKTQLKLSNDLANEKEQIIATIQKELEDLKSNANELSASAQNAKGWEEQYNAIKTKISHMDTLTNQYNEIKKNLIQKNQEAVLLSNELKEVKEQLATKETELVEINKQLSTATKKLSKFEPQQSPKKTINKEKTKTVPSIEIGTVKEETDDF